MYLALEPAGSGQLEEGTEIPLERTMSSYDVVEAFSDLSRTTERIDTDQLAESLDDARDRVRRHPREGADRPRRAEPALANHREPRTSSSASCCATANRSPAPSPSRTRRSTGSSRTRDLLVAELDRRREAIHTLFTNTDALAKQVTGLVRDNRADLRPALEELKKVLATLQKNEDNLQATIEADGAVHRVFANTLGNGRWFDTYIQNLTVPVGTVGG